MHCILESTFERFSLFLEVTLERDAHIDMN